MYKKGNPCSIFLSQLAHSVRWISEVSRNFARPGEDSASELDKAFDP